MGNKLWSKSEESVSTGKFVGGATSNEEELVLM
jgi:hypothetical protein